MTNGQAAYESWRLESDDCTPDWDELTRAEVIAWEAAAEAAILNNDNEDETDFDECGEIDDILNEVE